LKGTGGASPYWIYLRKKQNKFTKGTGRRKEAKNKANKKES
jgi:hypothetical protein